MWYKQWVLQVVLCKKESATYCLSVPLFVHFSFSPIKISVTDFSASIKVRAFKRCIHLEAGQVYCVKENHRVYIYCFLLFFYIFLFPSLAPVLCIWEFSVKDFSRTT